MRSFLFLNVYFVCVCVCARSVLELLDPGQHAHVFVNTQVRVAVPAVPGVEGMEPDHVQTLEHTCANQSLMYRP